MRPLVALAVLLLQAGCYRYVPLPASNPEVGADIRSLLSPDGASSVATVLGRNVRSFDAKLLSRDTDVWQFALSRTSTSDERVIAWAGESVRIPRSAIASMELRVLDRGKTVRAAVLGVAGGVAAGLIAKAISSGAGGDPPGGGQPGAAIIPK